MLPEPANLSGVVTDDGQPGGHLDITWKKLAGPGSVSFQNANATSTQASLAEPGEYRLQLVANDGGLVGQDEVAITADVQPADYYVSTDGSDTHDGRTIGRPFRTIRRAASVVGPGDLVFIRGGTYKEYNPHDSWITSGEPGRPITFSAFPGETVIIDGSDRHWSETPGNPSSPELIRLRNIDWYIFENLNLRNSAGRGLALEGDHHVVRNVVSINHHGDGIFLRGNNNLVEDSTSYGNYSVENGGDSADGIKIDSGNANIIRRVVAHNNSDDGFDLWDSTNTLVEYSLAFNNGFGTTGNGQGFKMSNDGRNDSGSIFRFNIAYGNRSHNFTDNGGGGLTVYNNTSWHAGQFGFVLRGRPNRVGSTAINNISFEDRDGVLIDVQDPGGTLPEARYNSWNLGIANPEFVSTESDDPGFLALVEGSPAVDAGIDVGHTFNGASPDLGARESDY